MTDSEDHKEIIVCGDKAQSYKEEHVYVCSECSAIFLSVETCKEHMLKDHALSLENAHNLAKDKPDNEISKPDNVLSEKSVFLQEEKSDSDNAKRISERKQSEKTKKFSFTLWRKAVFHLWKIHEIDIDLNKCGSCDYRTYSMFKLKNHKLIHGDERQFLCVTCGKSFKQMNQLRNHNLIHKDKKDLAEKRWYSEQECNICFRKFSDSKCLRKHITEVHKKIKPYNCKYCDYTTARKGMLQLHMRNHTGEKPYKCEFCEYCTGDHNSLRRHRMRHTGERRYSCPHCEYSSIQEDFFNLFKLAAIALTLTIHTTDCEMELVKSGFSVNRSLEIQGFMDVDVEKRNIVLRFFFHGEFNIGMFGIISANKTEQMSAISLKSHMISKHPGKEGAYSCALCQFTSINKEIFESHVSDHNQGLIPGTSIGSGNAESNLPILPYQPIGITTSKIDTEQTTTNVKTAETVSKCLYALTQTDGVAQLPPGVTALASQIEDGVQTVTIEIPGENGSLPQQFLLKIQPSSNEALHIMYQPVTEINENDLSTIKFNEELSPSTLKLPEIISNDSSPMAIIVNPDQFFLQEFKNTDQEIPMNAFSQISNIVNSEESVANGSNKSGESCGSDYKTNIPEGLQRLNLTTLYDRRIHRDIFMMRRAERKNISLHVPFMLRFYNKDLLDLNVINELFQTKDAKF
ncbi:Zinc finger and BTB domain-containing protein 24 [Nymphon striatum]|nr:Zinc finger and BTB domain-containing protein 24 [Nymphon striatum]